MTKWIDRIKEDRDKLSEDLKLRLVKAALMYTTPFLNPEEAETFLAPQEMLSDPNSLLSYCNIEKKVAIAYSSAYDEESEKWKKEEYIKEMREVLGRLYSPSDLDELERLLLGPWDVSALTMNVAGDNYGMRRIRNAYLPEITDLLEIDLETGQVMDSTKQLFREGPGDAVYRIEKLLGIKKSNI